MKITKFGRIEENENGGITIIDFAFDAENANLPNIDIALICIIERLYKELHEISVKRANPVYEYDTTNKIKRTKDAQNKV